jgi:hypothetical protein
MLMLRDASGLVIDELEGRLDEVVLSARAIDAAARFGVGLDLVTNGGVVVARTVARCVSGGQSRVGWEVLVSMAPSRRAHESGVWSVQS